MDVTGGLIFRRNLYFVGLRIFITMAFMELSEDKKEEGGEEHKQQFLIVK